MLVIFLVLIFTTIPSRASDDLFSPDNFASEIPCTGPTAEDDCGVYSICTLRPGTNQSFCFCKDDEACGSMNLVCAQNHTRCDHKPLWPLNMLDIFTPILLLFISALAAASGTGGGGLLVALYLAMESFPAREAMPLSKASILGGGIANFIYNFAQRHPEADRPLIDYDIVGVMEPMVLLGTVIGVYAIKLLPSWIVLALLVIVLAFTAYKTVQKGLSIYREERELAGALEELEKFDRFSIQMQDEEQQRDLLEKPEAESVAGQWLSAHEEEIREIRLRESKTPWIKMASFVLIWACVLAISFLKGGEGHDSLVGIQCGSLLYWVLVCSLIPVFVLYTAIFGYFLKKNHDRKKEIDFPFAKNDMQWNIWVLIKLPLLGLLCGIAAGLFGIGSGMIVGPVILSHQIHPRAVSAVSAFMILFTASSTTIQFSVFGLLRYDYAGFFAAFGFVGALLGQFGIGHLIKKYKKNSVVAFILAFMIIGGAIALGAMGVLNIVHKTQQGADLWALAPLCPKE